MCKNKKERVPDFAQIISGSPSLKRRAPIHKARNQIPLTVREMMKRFIHKLPPKNGGLYQIQIFSGIGSCICKERKEVLKHLLYGTPIELQTFREEGAIVDILNDFPIKSPSSKLCIVTDLAEDLRAVIEIQEQSIAVGSLIQGDRLYSSRIASLSFLLMRRVFSKNGVWRAVLSGFDVSCATQGGTIRLPSDGFLDRSYHHRGQGNS